MNLLLQAKRLRNPYIKLSYDKLTDLLRNTSFSMKIAVENKDFISCTHLEEKLEKINIARNSIVLPERIPKNRLEINLYSLELKFALDYATQVKDAVKMKSLQDRQIRINTFKEKYPSSKELSIKVTKLNDELTESMSKKDFKKCRELQSSIHGLEKELSDINREDNVLSMSIRK